MGNNQTESAAASGTNRALSVLLHCLLQLARSKLVPRFTPRCLPFSSSRDDGRLFWLARATKAVPRQTHLTHAVTDASPQEADRSGEGGPGPGSRRGAAVRPRLPRGPAGSGPEPARRWHPRRPGPSAEGGRRRRRRRPPARNRACAAAARGRAAAVRGSEGGSGRRGRGPVAMATAAEGLPEAGAQSAKRKGPGSSSPSPSCPLLSSPLRLRVRPLAAWRWTGPARPRPAPGAAAAVGRWGGGRLPGGPAASRMSAGRLAAPLEPGGCIPPGSYRRVPLAAAPRAAASAGGSRGPLGSLCVQAGKSCSHSKERLARLRKMC